MIHQTLYTSLHLDTMQLKAGDRQLNLENTMGSSWAEHPPCIAQCL